MRKRIDDIKDIVGLVVEGVHEFPAEWPVEDYCILFEGGSYWSSAGLDLDDMLEYGVMSYEEHSQAKEAEEVYYHEASEKRDRAKYLELKKKYGD